MKTKEEILAILLNDFAIEIIENPNASVIRFQYAKS